MNIRVIKEIRKGKILQPSAIGCLKKVPTLNVAKGCIFSCVYCYARGYRDAPPKGEVHVYQNLAQRLEEELDNPRRRKSLPSYVYLNTSSDSFQPLDEVLQVTMDVVEKLFQRGIGISLLTKGFIPKPFIDLFQKNSDKVFVQVGIISFKEDFCQRYEPFASHSQERLENIKNLKRAGVQVGIRMDPLIPMISDGTKELELFFDNLSREGIDTVSLSYLMMRPSILRQIKAELPDLHSEIIQSHYRFSPCLKVASSCITQLPPKGLRERNYARIKEIAKAYGIKVLVCSCKNPDMGGDRCTIKQESFLGKIPQKGVQLKLFND